MISDLLKLLQAIEAAQSAEEKARLSEELSAAVKSDIRQLFDDATSDQLSFSAIKDALGIFDPEEKQQELKQILYGMGARRTADPDENEAWHFPKAVQEPKEPPKKPPWSLIYAIILIVVLVIGAFSIFGNPFSQGPKTCSRTELNPTELDECMQMGGTEVQ